MCSSDLLTCPHCANFHKKIFEELNAEFIEKKLVKFEHHAFPLDLAALNAEKLLRCTSQPARRFDLLKIISIIFIIAKNSSIYFYIFITYL